MTCLVKGDFYNNLVDERKDTAALKQCMEKAVSKLLETKTEVEKPGMLLGRIQSGKTRAFIGIIALAFDNGYDMAIVLTKGTKVLAQQTYERLKTDFAEFVQDDKVQICDIMHLPGNFTKYELAQKLIIVVKKQKDNLSRMIKALVATYPDLIRKKLIIIDDEADYASVCYRMTRGEGFIEIAKIARQISELREKIASYDFLQVTATPYSLYLQPSDFEGQGQDLCIKPVRPAFTVLLPAYEGYIGGEFYFDEGMTENTLSSFLYEEVRPHELGILKKEDRRKFKLEDALTSDSIMKLRDSIMNFIVGACIRRLQQTAAGERLRKYSFLIHTEQRRKCHEWQRSIVVRIKALLVRCVNSDNVVLDRLVLHAYDDILHSMKAIGADAPIFDDVRKAVYTALNDDYIMITKVNSDREVEQLLDERGQLKLRTPLNIFIGGQILDRGITVENLIGFYYGRSPHKFQQDTVLQHSRMYGNRPKADLAVTRFYTARTIYEALRRIHEFDTTLREAFEQKEQDAGVVFMRADPNNQIIPCNPNKILLSATTIIKPYKRMLPVGFQTLKKTHMRDKVLDLDELIASVQPHRGERADPCLIKQSIAQLIISRIAGTLEFETGFEWDVQAFKASMEYMSTYVSNQENRNRVWCLVRKNRNLSRIKADGTFSDAPDTPKTEGRIAVETAIDIPILMLFRQNGKEEQGWNGSPFWWPVLMAPRNVSTAVFASDVVDDGKGMTNDSL